MKNYDAIMQTMTPERMAESNVKLVTVNSTNLFYMTSSGQLFPTNQLDDAIRYEYNWLMTDPSGDTECDCDRECSCTDCNCAADEEVACGQPDCACESVDQSPTDEVAN